MTAAVSPGQVAETLAAQDSERLALAAASIKHTRSAGQREHAELPQLSGQFGRALAVERLLVMRRQPGRRLADRRRGRALQSLYAHRPFCPCDAPTRR